MQIRRNYRNIRRDGDPTQRRPNIRKDGCQSPQYGIVKECGIYTILAETNSITILATKKTATIEFFIFFL